jgi:hypothetical protein
MPLEVLAVLQSHPDVGRIVRWEAEPECRVRFDALRGEPANVDLLLKGEDEEGGFVMAVEAKADEPFGALVVEHLATTVDRGLGQPRSKGVTRIEHLARAVLGPRKKGAPGLGEIRYQLLTVTAAAIAAARAAGVDRAIVMVHEFRTERTTRERLERNKQDLTRFARRLGMDEPIAVLQGKLCGPISVPGAPLFDDVPRLYLGKAVRRTARTGGGEAHPGSAGDVELEPWERRP